jgi:hypothetical protein
MPQINPQTGIVRINGWPKGVDNRQPDFSVADGYLRDALNVDILSSGNIRRRRGIRQAVASSGAHSVFSDGNRMVWWTKDTLYYCGTDLVAHALNVDKRYAKPISCVRLNGDIYFSNEDVNGKILATNEYTPWGIIPPVNAPTCAGNGSSRTYQVTCTFVTATGEESGAPLGAVVLCGDPARITVTTIPQSIDPRVVATRLYATNIDDAVFSHVADVPTGTTQWVIQGYFANGARLKTQFNSNPPPGQLLEEHYGTIYIASGNTMWHTDPLRPNIFDNAASFFLFTDRITMMRSVGKQGIREHEGMFVSADATRFIPFIGTHRVENWPKYPYKAIEGTGMRLPDNEAVVWFSDSGYIKGLPGGQIENLTEAQISVPEYARGAMGYQATNGHQAIVTILQTPLVPSFASPDVAAEQAAYAADIA